MILPIHFPGGRLRRLETADLEAFQSYRSIPELGRYQGWSPMSDDAARAFLEEMSTAPLFTRGEWIQLGIGEDGGRLVGDIGLFLSEDGTSAEIGFTLSPASQGRGVATVAVRAAIELVFASTDVTHVLGITDSRNAASVRLLQRTGFRHSHSLDTLFRGEACIEDVHVLPRPGR